MGFLSIAEPALYRPVSETGLSASIGVIERGHVLVVDRIESPKLAGDAVALANNIASARRIRRRELRYIGRELPIHSNALGKAILACLPEHEVLAMIRKQGFINGTQHTIASETQLLADLESTRKRGYSISMEEQYPGNCAFGAPIFGPDGAVRAAVSLTGDREQPWHEDRDRFANAVKAAARAISQRGTFRNHGLRPTNE